ncbi:MAG: fluoride efflux transporter CrcB [Acidobacteriota bacterium]
MIQLLWIGCGGFLGAIARHLLSSWAQRWAPLAFPLGTLAVNVVGCFALGALMAWLERGAPPTLRPLVGVGFLGALTTFSTFGYETLELLRQGEMLLAAASVVANVVVGLGAVWLGVTLIDTLAG